MRSLKAIFIAVTLVAAATAQADQKLSIKGFKTGMSAASICTPAGAAIKDVDAPHTELFAEYPAMRKRNATTCDITISTYGSQPVAEPAQILFMNDRLIQVKFHMEPMTWTNAAAFYSGLQQAFGQGGGFKRSTAFVTRTWMTSGDTLSISRPTGGDPDLMTMEVVLRNEAQMKEFMKINDYNSAILDKASKKAAAKDAI